MKIHATTRRRFLAQSTAAIGFPMVIPASAIGRGRPAPSSRIRVAVFGWGTIASDWTPSFLNNGKCQVVAVADPMKAGTNYGYRGEKRGGRDVGKETIDKFYGGAANKPVRACTAYADFRELFEKEDIDAVQICTPDHWHCYLAVAAARKGLHLYGQKPLALTIGEGRRMVDEIAKAGVTWQTGSQQRSDFNFRFVSELARNGRIGRVKRVRIGLPGGHTDWNRWAARTAPEPVPADFDYDMWLGPAPQMEYRPALLPLNWRHNYHFSGGMVTDFGAHHIDIAMWAMGRNHTGPVEFKNIRGTLPAGTELYNTATAFHFECTFDDGLEFVIADASERIMPELDALNKDSKKPADHTGIFFEGENGKWLWVDRGRKAASDIDIFREKLAPDEIHLYESKDHTDNFLTHVRDGKPVVAPVEDAHRTISIAHIGNIGLRLGRTRLRWDPVAERFPDDADANAMLQREWRRPWLI